MCFGDRTDAREPNSRGGHVGARLVVDGGSTSQKAPEEESE